MCQLCATVIYQRINKYKLCKEGLSFCCSVLWVKEQQEWGQKQNLAKYNIVMKTFPHCFMHKTGNLQKKTTVGEWWAKILERAEMAKLTA